MRCAWSGCRHHAEVVVTSGADGVVAAFFCVACAVKALRVKGTRLLLLRGLRPVAGVRRPGA